MTADENGLQPSDESAPEREHEGGGAAASPRAEAPAADASPRAAAPAADASPSTGAPAADASPSAEAPAAADAPAAGASPGDSAAEAGDETASGEDAGEGDEGDGEESSAGTIGAESATGEGAKRKRRRRRRRKGGAPGEASAAGTVPAEGEEPDAGAQPQAGAAPHGGPRKDIHLPFARFFEGQGRGERRHAFSVGEIVAGRVLRVEHGASVIDLFGKATSYALANERREVPLPIPGAPEGAEADEPEESAEASAPSGPDLSHVGDAAAGFEGAVGMPASESLPPPPAGVDGAQLGGPGPDGIWGTEDDEPPSGEADPARIARAARGLSALGTPSEDGDPDAVAREAAESASEPAGTESETGALEAPEESAAAAATEEEPPPLEVGQIFRGRVAAVAESGHVAIHNHLVTRAAARLELAKAREEHRRVWGLVYGFNRGGFDVLVSGVRAFCPVSGMTVEHVEDPETLLGQRLEFSVQQAKSGHQGIVVSRRSILEREARKRAKELRRSLQPGQAIKGRVTQVRDFGLFVDIGGGVEGLVHMSEVSWDRAVRPADAAKPGDEVEVQVLRVTEPQGRKERDGRISLSLKALAPDPWEVNLQGVEEGQARKGKVTRTAEFGAFVELAPGVEGLLHVTELGRDLKHASERIKEGEEVFVVVERLDKRARRISLSKMSDQEAKLFQEGQLESVGGKPIRQGSSVKVKVDRVESGGLYVQIEGVIGRRGRGFIPNAEMMTERGTDHRKKFPPGTEIDVKVIGTDREGGLRLSRKAYHQDEERRAVQDYRKEAARKGFGTFGDILKSKLGGKR